MLIDGRSEGKAWSYQEFRSILSREGVPEDNPVRWLGEDETVWPDRAGLRRTTGFFMVVGLLATAYPLFKIGASDSNEALTYGGRIAGFTILAVAVMEVVAAAAAVDYWGGRRWRYSGVAVLIGVLIALFCSLSILVLQIGEQLNRYTAIGIALGVWSVAALWELLECRAWKGLRVPKSIAIGVVVSVLLAGSNLAYSQIYVPYVTTPLILGGAEFKESNMKQGGSLYVTVHLSVKNAGQVPVYLLGSIYWIHGAPASPPDVELSQYDLIDDGEFVTPVGRVLNPGEEVAQDAVVEIQHPENRKEHPYEALRAETEVYVIRKDRMTLSPDYQRSRVDDAARIVKEDGDGAPKGAAYRDRSQMENSSEILNATRGPQRITVWKVDSGDWPRFNVDVSPPGERIDYGGPHPLENQEAIERYGLSREHGSMAQTPYPELLEKARATEKGAAPPSTAAPTPPPPQAR
ncbi:hypothetical protein DEJ51_14650 [Streptomyces venezuelae]|uniref:Uncharacterized protein n=1 Tax=Streptomyces venezuelae TaxID=54571 RepID=A0A5P2DKJ6_STRVZ|nr:hypothetical protein DEJ51_14650 [Streptomyces venezuelae]